MANQTNPDAIDQDFINEYINVPLNGLDLDGQVRAYAKIVRDYIDVHPLKKEYIYGDKYKKGGLNVLERGFINIAFSFLLSPETIIEKCMKYAIPYVRVNLETQRPVMDFDAFFKESLTLNEKDPEETNELKAILFLIWGDLNKEDKYLIEVYVKRFTLITYHIISKKVEQDGRRNV